MSSPKDSSAAPAPKKAKLEESSQSALSSAPPYGSQQYWEDRYRRQFQKIGGENDDRPNEEEAEETLPYHAWYFSYEELRPLIIPLLLGGRDEARMILASAEEEDQDSTAEDDEDDDNDDTGGIDQDVEDSIDNESTAEEGDKKSNNDEAENDDDEVVEDEDDDLEEFVEGEDQDEDEAPERDGIATHAPANVLEVGCGDVPLGVGLARELSNLQNQTGAKASGIVRKIVCTDYSQVVVDMMKKEHCTANSAPNEKKDDDDDADKLAPISVEIEFATADARKMSYEDRSFDLILEKGTLDAMLSDKQEGVENCIQIVTECARLLALRGYIVIISHLNAHTERAVGWLGEVVFTGLKRGDEKAAWLIEVHGQEEAADGTAGPAVYIIQKQALSDSPTQKDKTIPVKFFSY